MRRQEITTYDQAVAYLLDVPKFTTKNAPTDTGAYLEKLGNPDKHLKIIHVAGTNGKGSVCAYMRGILEAAGYTTAVFTSPHLVDIRERFLIKNQMVSKEEFLQAFLRVYENLDWEALTSDKGYHPTFFEYLFFMAMIIFEKAGTDFCILETGLGGRLDATNSVTHKELTVITRISLDHVEYLGDTIQKIAGEKAGIMREGTPVVFADVEDDATAVFADRANKLKIPVKTLSKKHYVFEKNQNKNIDFSLYTDYYGYISLHLHTQARYQMENASLAVVAIEQLDQGRTISREQIQQGIENCIWQGRMEEVLPNVYVDGAHNEDGIRAFLESVKEDGHDEDRMLMFGVVKDKDYPNMIRKLTNSNMFSEIAIVHMNTRRSADLDDLQTLFNQEIHGKTHCTYTYYDNVETALTTLLDNKPKTRRLYIAGSLYLVGEVKAYLAGKESNTL